MNLMSSTGLIAVVVAVGCGGGSGTTGAPADSKTIVVLSDGELGAYCDQLAAIEGGYSHPKDLNCEGGSSSVTFEIGNDQASCKTLLKSLPSSCANLTVGQVKACVTDTYGATCATSGNSLPSCDPFFSCIVGG